MSLLPAAARRNSGKPYRPSAAPSRGVQGDVSNLADLDRLYKNVQAKGRIDVLFANVGLGGFVPLESITEEYYDKTFDTNVKGLLFTVQKALPFLNDGASIILTGSAAAAKALPASASYAASKAAGSLLRANLDRRAEGPAYPRKCSEPWACHDAAGGAPAAGRHRAHRVHGADGPHGGARRDRQGRALSGLG